MDLSMFVRGQPIVPASETTHKQERVNLFSLMIIKQSFFDTTRGSIPTSRNQGSDKVEIRNLMSKFTDANYDNVGGLMDYVLRIV